MLKTFAGVVAVTTLFSLDLAPERIDAQPAKTPAACAAERSRAERAGRPGWELDADVSFAAEADRLYSLRTSDEYRVIAADATKPESERAYYAYLMCVYQARVAQLASLPAPTVLIVSTQTFNTVGNMAAALAAAWGGAAFEGAAGPGNTPALEAIAALEAGPADGSRLLLIPIPRPTAANARPVVDALARLQRIVLVAGPGAATQSGAGLFAPSRTSATRVAELTRQATTALSAPSFSAALERARLAPPTSDISTTLQSVLSRLPAAPSAAPVPPAAPPRAPSPGGASTFATNLRPTDFFLEEQGPNGFITVLVGKTLAEALANQVRYYGRTAPTVAGTITSCSRVAGRMTVGWWAMVVGYHDPLRPTGEPRRRDSSWGMSCAAATVEQAIAGAYDAAKGKAKEKSKGPFSNYWLYAGVTAELDYARLAAEKRLSNVVPLAAWVMTCETPDTLDWARASFFPQDPGNGAAFSKYVLSPQLKQRQYSYVQGRVPVTGYFGCTGFGHTPEPNQPPPVFGTR